MTDCMMRVVLDQDFYVAIIIFIFLQATLQEFVAFLLRCNL